MTFKSLYTPITMSSQFQSIIPQPNASLRVLSLLKIIALAHKKSRMFRPFFVMVSKINCFSERFFFIVLFRNKSGFYFKETETRLLVSRRSPESSDCLLRFYGAVILFKKLNVIS